MSERTNVRERILDAAVGLLQQAGKLAQPQVAKAAGVPQGHLTYYFPKRFDLLAAATERFVEMVRHDLPSVLTGEAWDRTNEAMRAKAYGFVMRLMKDRARTRMLLGLLVASEEDPALRELMADKVVMVRSLLAHILGKDESDPDVDIALGAFWGIGLQHLVLEGRRSDADTEAIVARMREWIALAPPPRSVANNVSPPPRASSVPPPPSPRAAAPPVAPVRRPSTRPPK